MKRFALVVESDPRGRVRWLHVGQARFLDDDHLVIGRDRSFAGLVVHSDVVSRVQCALHREEHGFFVVDERSAGGTWVNSRRVVGRQRLDVGDRFRMGDVTLRFDVVDTDPLARVRMLGGFLVLDVDDLDEPGVRRAFSVGTGLVIVVSSPHAYAPFTAALVEPACVDAWSDAALAHRAYAVAGGVPFERIESAGGSLDLAVANRVLADVVDLVARVYRPVRLVPASSDVLITWAGEVVIVPRVRPVDDDVVDRRLSALLWDVSRTLPGGALGAVDDDCETRLALAYERSHASLFPAASDHALAALVRGLFPAEHAAHVELAEQLALLDDDGLRWLADKRG